MPQRHADGKASNGRIGGLFARKKPRNLAVRINSNESAHSDNKERKQLTGVFHFKHFFRTKAREEAVNNSSPSTTKTINIVNSAQTLLTSLVEEINERSSPASSYPSSHNLSLMNIDDRQTQSNMPAVFSFENAPLVISTIKSIEPRADELNPSDLPEQYGSERQLFPIKNVSTNLIAHSVQQEIACRTDEQSSANVLSHNLRAGCAPTEGHNKELKVGSAIANTISSTPQSDEKKVNVVVYHEALARDLPLTNSTSSEAPRSLVRSTSPSHSDSLPQLPETHATAANFKQSTASASKYLAPTTAPSLQQHKQQPIIRAPAQTPPVFTDLAIVSCPKAMKAKSYEAIPLIETLQLPRGGLSLDTKAVGRVQFGIPPETIKDSMCLGIPVPQVYIVPVDRFCREMGPALGINLAEFEFPAYFNYFVHKKRCTLVVDSKDTEENIRRVFSETLLGPEQFRQKHSVITHDESDFASSFPQAAVPNFRKELEHFRIMPDGKELVIETLLSFIHFEYGHSLLRIAGEVSDIRAHLHNHASSEGDQINGLANEVMVPIISLDDVADEDCEDCEMMDSGHLSDTDRTEDKVSWSYSQSMCELATIWPVDATEDQINQRIVPRVEILKIPSSTEYILHDIDADNYIIGRARFSGNVRIVESMCFDGFGGRFANKSPLPSFSQPFASDHNLEDTSEVSYEVANLYKPPPTFHPPSFGVTVLGNSHGFDKNGSVSGYVLWINGRGVMIDPPPYSSATLESEGIRPRLIVGIILTHCHADHDAGAFQKVLTGSPVVVITTPTIYKSFIRKYSALSALSPALLRRSHRYKPALIGQPLRFQGATFYFTYTLHTIPCIGFRVEWRGRSIVFTGDHFNSPPALNQLEENGVLSKARADDLRRLPLQECDVLLHEAGAPPIHTPLEVLLQLPERVKKRLYVVHTSALPDGCKLRVAPTGTKHTIRLDHLICQPEMTSLVDLPAIADFSTSYGRAFSSRSFSDDEIMWTTSNEYNMTNGTIIEEADADLETKLNVHSECQLPLTKLKKHRSTSVFNNNANVAPPLVSLRPASSTDAWFILNLLSAVPFISDLSYSCTMAVLEMARVDAFSVDSIVLPAARRSQVLCVIWEGTCFERATTKALLSGRPLSTIEDKICDGAVWHAGDWTGPIVLQPERQLSSESSKSKTHDLVAVSAVGVKVITINFSDLHMILKQGSKLYSKYLKRVATQEKLKTAGIYGNVTLSTVDLLQEKLVCDNVFELLSCNSALCKLSAVQKRHLESLAEGPVTFQPNERMWRCGGPVDKTFLIVRGTASFVKKRRSRVSANDVHPCTSCLNNFMRTDAFKALKELEIKEESFGDDSSFSSQEDGDELKFDFDSLRMDLLKRANLLQMQANIPKCQGSLVETKVQLENIFIGSGAQSQRASALRRRSSRARLANKALGQLYRQQNYTEEFIFSRGHFLGNISKMVEEFLSHDGVPLLHDEVAPENGFGDVTESTTSNIMSKGIAEVVVSKQEAGDQVLHTSTLKAGENGCVAFVLPKCALIPFFDAYPGLLLSLLGTQVVI